MSELEAKILGYLREGPTAVRNLYDLGDRDQVRAAINTLMSRGKIEWVGRGMLSIARPDPARQDLSVRILELLADGDASCTEILDVVSIATGLRRADVGDAVSDLLRDGRIHWSDKRRVGVVK